MPRLSAIVAIASATILLGCGDSKQPEQQPAPAPASDDGDAFSNTIEEAMCGTPDQRAHAIGGIASDPEFSSQSDEVYSQASDLAEKGCPERKG